MSEMHGCEHMEIVAGMGCTVIDSLGNTPVFFIFDSDTLSRFIGANDLPADMVQKFVEYAGTTTMFSANGHIEFVMILNYLDNRCIVHECVHLANMILESKGIEYSPDSDEILAYTVDYLFSVVRACLDAKIEEGSVEVALDPEDETVDNKPPAREEIEAALDKAIEKIKTGALDPDKPIVEQVIDSIDNVELPVSVEPMCAGSGDCEHCMAEDCLPLYYI